MLKARFLTSFWGAEKAVSKRLYNLYDVQLKKEVGQFFG